MARMRRLLPLIFFILLLFLGIQPVPSEAITVTSTFDTGLDGWTALGANISWVNTGGNPGGALSSSDSDAGWAQIIAPSKFHGFWGQTGYVSADIKFVGTGTIALPVAFAITNGNTTYQYVFSNPTKNWVTYTAALNSSNWSRLTNNNQWYNWNPPIGNQTLAQVLNNVTGFRIRTDYVNGIPDDQAYIDNVRLVPLPPTVLLLGSALAGLAAWRRRR